MNQETQALELAPDSPLEIAANYAPATFSKPAMNKRGDRRGVHLMKHGLSRTRTHRIWCKMKERCNNRRAINYERYGGSGVIVCERWKEFALFLEDMGTCPSEGHSIERLSNDLGYYPGNCCWATVLKQANNKRNNVFIAFDGRIQSIADWCRELNLDYNLTRQRFYRDGWTAERAFQR